MRYINLHLHYITMTSVTRPCFTKQHQTCKTKTKTKTNFWLWDRSCPKTDSLRPHHRCLYASSLDYMRVVGKIARIFSKPAPMWRSSHGSNSVPPTPSYTNTVWHTRSYQIWCSKLPTKIEGSTWEDRPPLTRYHRIWALLSLQGDMQRSGVPFKLKLCGFFLFTKEKKFAEICPYFFWIRIRGQTDWIETAAIRFKSRFNRLRWFDRYWQKIRFECVQCLRVTTFGRNSVCNLPRFPSKIATRLSTKMLHRIKHDAVLIVFLWNSEPAYYVHKKTPPQVDGW